MDEKELYENQYGKKLLHAPVFSFPILRKWFPKLDLNRWDVVLSLLDQGETLLDVGCGSGSFLFMAQSHFRELHGIDISPSRISEAKINASKYSNQSKKFEFYEGNINGSMPFVDSFFDCVTSIAVIEHVFDPYPLVREIHRVLKKDGVFVAQVPNIAYIRHRIHLLFGKLPITATDRDWEKIGWDGGHLHYFTQKTFCRMLEDCGFDILEVTGSGLFARFRNFYPALLTGDLCVKARKRN